MGLNKSKGNMYGFITHTWNPLGGKCLHNCVYCSTKSFIWPEVIKKYSSKLRLIEEEFKTNLGKGNFIFVAAQNDLFHGEIIADWIQKIIDYCNKFDNKYLFQTKCPSLYKFFKFPVNTILSTTLESNRYYKELYDESCPPPEYRANSLGIASQRYNTMVTIEPILDFDLKEFIEIIKWSDPIQVNIGADSKGHNLPEPPKEKILKLISKLKKFTEVHLKENLNRLLK